MKFTRRDAGDAAQLIARGLEPKLRPARDPAYADLLERHRTDPDFRELVLEIAAGLGLVVLDAGITGIVLGPDEDSVFSLRLPDYRRNLSVADRLLHGLIHVGIAAFCFPTAASLAADDVPRIAVNDVERFLRGAAERLRETRGEEDPDADRSRFEAAWRRYLRTPAARETGDGRAAARTTTQMIRYALRTLAAHGLFVKESDAAGGTFRALDRYRVQVRELAATAAWRVLGGLAGCGGAPCST